MVMIRVDIAEAKARFSRYIAMVGRGGTVIVCRRNVPVAERRPLPNPLRDRRPVGIDREMEVPANFFKPFPDDLLAASEGEAGDG